jgi:hypothetical protein
VSAAGPVSVRTLNVVVWPLGTKYRCGCSESVNQAPSWVITTSLMNEVALAGGAPGDVQQPARLVELHADRLPARGGVDEQRHRSTLEVAAEDVAAVQVTGVEDGSARCPRPTWRPAT